MPEVAQNEKFCMKSFGYPQTLIKIYTLLIMS